ncbi:hypothetical protein PG993_014841 [Apiospora rasikravindrae]|uniref:Uncharacterized protein n=1 Tax=Apiospora rasikravindrae TaxID=990691 RepID=A0ABR1RP43_9PEZI
MLSLMDCVVSFNNKDINVCRGTDSIDKNFDEWQNRDNAFKETCLSPREVLLYKSNSICRSCSLTGALQACPKDDPQFINCLCEQGAQSQHFRCFSECFRNDRSINTNICQNWRKRDQLIDAESYMATSKVVERRAQPTSYPPVTFNTDYWDSEAVPPLSYYYRLTDARSHTALVVCTVDPIQPTKSCYYVTNQAAVSTNINHYIHPSEPTGLTYESKVTSSPTGSLSIASETARPSNGTPQSVAHAVSASTSAMMGMLTLALFLVT